MEVAINKEAMANASKKMSSQQTTNDGVLQKSKTAQSQVNLPIH